LCPSYKINNYIGINVSISNQKSLKRSKNALLEFDNASTSIQRDNVKTTYSLVTIIGIIVNQVFSISVNFSSSRRHNSSIEDLLTLSQNQNILAIAWINDIW
jgi:hypothetical protein